MKVVVRDRLMVVLIFCDMFMNGYRLRNCIRIKLLIRMVLIRIRVSLVICEVFVVGLGLLGKFFIIGWDCFVRLV